MSHPSTHHARPRTLRQLAALGLLAGAAAVGACSDASPVAPSLDGSVLATSRARTTVTEPTSGSWSRIVEGETGPGALYALFIPREPNGDAVYIAHGFRDATSPVDLRDQDNLYALRDSLGARGYAVAYSSYATNGLAVKDGVQRTHQLRGLLTAQLGGAPARELLVGYSLGATVALDLAETRDSQYDGALLACGMVGGTLLQTQYLGHTRALFDAFFPGALPGSVLGYPGAFTLTPQDVGNVVAPHITKLFAIASTAETPLPYIPGGPMVQTMIGSLYGALQFHARGINDIVDRVHGQSPFENAETIYSRARTIVPGIDGVLDAHLAAANVSVVRHTMGAAAGAYLRNHDEPSGDLQIPVVTLHNMWDPGVPAFHEDALRDVVNMRGAGAQLLQRGVPSYGHCAFSVNTVLRSFDDLAGWVAGGVKPAS